MTDVDIAVLGAGPYGLATTAHLRRAGADVRVIGDPMSFWRTMPEGMVLRSNWTATCIGEYEGPLSLDSYMAATGARFGRPIPLDRFIDYGGWVQQQVAPDVDVRQVELVQQGTGGFRLAFADGGRLHARRVVVAAGIAPFAHRPAWAAGLPAELVSHTSDHRDLSWFRGRRVLVVGGGQSALESAALLHENGAEVEVAARKDHLTWLHGGKYHRMLGRWAPLVYAPTDVGPMGLSRLVALPDLFRRLPRPVQEPLAHRAIRPAGAAWLQPRLVDVPIRLDSTVRELEPVGNRVRVRWSTGVGPTVDHVVLGTGYRVDVARYPFLAPPLVDALQRVGGYPVLGPGMETSVPGLHIVGAPAAWSFGPIMRFVSGGWYTGQAVARRLTQTDHRGSRRTTEDPVERQAA
ncbi:NAD(P)-binding domain-containing protein [Petropleomorpha daqingensis]|uniref:Cation diffusion facilitator CzcD-associated flavoprotein CzcO n=1 Tax=Petropleomorpha daqingensis TaxID=2026353 RepID=A0A853CFA4_9ACTN|nr:NAD(P)-binding domain-containing protein [Petropleomorpha daqingensis]NYJ05846.1 cation diffusion facilitator CzcD-associated flavoprotein CzcO [Petropleomorpha daqingensis]